MEYKFPQLLSQWLTERRLNLISQQKGLDKNLEEEIFEFLQATTKHDRIDALCDIIVFITNGTTLEFTYDPIYYNPKTELEFIYDLISNHRSQDYQTMLTQCIGYLYYKLKVDVDKAMEEVYKEISSRTGSYDNKQKKWIKDTSEEAKAKWYKADFSKCGFTDYPNRITYKSAIWYK